MSEETKGTTPSQSPVMSREEWGRWLCAIGKAYASENIRIRLDWPETKEQAVDMLVSLQAEVEALRADLGAALSVISSARKDLEWSDSGTHHEAAYHALNDFEKARQPK